MNLKHKLSRTETGRPALACGVLLASMLTFLLLALPMGAAAQTAQFSYAERAIGSGFASPQGVAVDANGDLFVADTGHNLVKEILAVNGTIPASPAINTLGGSFSFSDPESIAVDASGNVYVGCINSGVFEILAAGGYTTVQQLGGTTFYDQPYGIAVDKSGNVYVADSYNNYASEMTPNCLTTNCITKLGGGEVAGHPEGIAVDSSGNVYVSDDVPGTVLEMTPNCTSSSCVTTIATGFDDNQGLAVDKYGNVYVADNEHDAVKEIVAVNGSVSASSSVVTLASNFYLPEGVAVDALGDIYVASSSNPNPIYANQLTELETPVMNFGTVPVANASADVSMIAVFAVSGYSGSFTPTIVAHYGHDYSVGAVSCANTSSGENCSATVTFQPTLPGGRKDALFVMDGTTRLTSELMGGVGQAPQAMMYPGLVTNLVSASSNDLYDSAVDENGTVYVVSGNSSSVYSVTAAGVVTKMPITVTSPSGIAVDGAGVLYIAQNAYSKDLVTYDTVTDTPGTLCVAPPAGGSSCTTSVNNDYLFTVAVDQLGNVFATDIEYTPISVVELTPAGNYITTAINPAITQPYELAVDSSGNIFPGGYTINEIPANGTQSEINTTGANSGIAVDAAGTLYATRYSVPPYDVAMLPASNYATPLAGIDGGTSGEIESPLGLGLGSDGTLYVGNYSDLDKVDRTQGVIAFGEQNSNVASSPQAVGVYNGGNQNLTLASFGSAGSGFTMVPAATNGCSTNLVIAPGQLCYVDVTANFPHAGTFSGTVTFTTNSLNTASTTQSVALSGFVYGPYVTTTQSAAFGNQNVGTLQTMTVTLTNTGDLYNAELNPSLSTVPTGFSVSGGTGAGSCGNAEDEIAPGASCTVTVTFDPTSAISYSGTISIPVASSGGGGPWPAVTFAATGAGILTVPIASLSPNPLAFGGQVYETTSPAQAVVLSNTGGSALTGIVPTLTGTNPGDFAIATGTNACGSTLAAGSSCNFWITFTPINAGNLQATLSVADNASPSPQTATLTGTYDYFYSNVGTALAAQPVSVYITTAGTLNSIQVLTQGYAGLDFSYAPGGSCTTDTAYTVGQFCTVNVVFNPLVPGARLGGVLLTTSLNVPLGESYLPGTGGAGEIVYSIGVQSALPGPTYASNYSAPSGIAVDASGNVYVADTGNSAVSRLFWNGTSFGTPFKLPFTNLDQPEAVAVDGVGNVFVADTKSFRILELPWRGPPGFGNQIVLDSSGLPDPDGIAVDYEGNLFFSDGSNDKVYEMPWMGNGYGAPTALAAATGLHTPTGLAVDSNLNLYIADSNDHQVVELPWTNKGYTSETVVDTGLDFPEAVAVDANGDLYIANTNAGTVIELTSTFGSFNTPFTLDFSGLGTSNGMALDSSGNIYVADGTKNDVVQLNVSNPPSLSFTSTNLGSTSSNSPQTVTVWNIGNGDVTIQSAIYPTDFPANTKDKNLCESDDGIGGGASCDVSVNFTPTTTGLLSEDVVLTDNNLNVSRATQSIAVSGTAAGLPAPTINWTPATPITYGTALGSGDFAATASSGDANVSADGTFAYTITSVGGTAATATTVLPGGADTLCVQWTPSSSFTSQYSSASLCVPIQVNAASTTISWTPATPILSPAPLGAGQFNASASAGSTNVSADGTLVYYVGPVSGGVVASNSTVLPVGSDQLCVQWTPSSSYTADYSPSSLCANVTVNAPTSISYAPASPITYGTTLGSAQLNASASSGSTNIGADGTFTYYVTSVGGTVATSSTVLPGGSDTLCVQWTPSSSFTSQYSSASLCSPITVNAAATSIGWSPSSASIIASSGPTAGQFDATAVAGETSVTADGTMTYHLATAGGTPVATGATLPLGPVTICAVWAPSSSFALDYVGSNACQSFTVINTQPTTATLAANTNSVFSTNSVTFTATVTPTSGTIVPTGTVTFLDGTTVIGTGTLSASGTGASAIAKLTTSSLAIGSQPITASYPGDTNNQASTTATLTELVEDFSIVATGSTSNTIEPGTSTTFTFTVSPVAPATTFPAAIALTASGLPTGATYSFSPASIASGAGSTSVTLTVTTPITTLVRNQPPRSPAQNARWPVMALALLLLPLAGKFRRAGRGFSRMLSLVLLFAAGIVAAAALNGCGGIASGYFGQAPATSTITVTGTSGSLTHSASVSLTVE